MVKFGKIVIELNVIILNFIIFVRLSIEYTNNLYNI
jgi:hypothetical protein